MVFWLTRFGITLAIFYGLSKGIPMFALTYTIATTMLFAVVGEFDKFTYAGRERAEHIREKWKSVFPFIWVAIPASVLTAMIMFIVYSVPAPICYSGLLLRFVAPAAVFVVGGLVGMIVDFIAVAVANFAGREASTRISVYSPWDPLPETNYRPARPGQPMGRPTHPREKK